MRFVSLFHEPPAFFDRQGLYGGALPEKWEAFQEGVFSEEGFRALADVGINLILISYYKGYGLGDAAEGAAHTARAVELAHRFGIKVLIYVQWGTLMPEHRVAEDLNLKELEIEGLVDQTGIERYWRQLPNSFSEKFLDYICRASAQGLQETKADGIWLDNIMVRGGRGELTRTYFHNWLAARYSDQEWTRISGIPAIKRTAVPVGGGAGVHDPVYRAFVRCVADRAREIHQRIRAAVKAVGPDLIYGGHPNSGWEQDASNPMGRGFHPEAYAGLLEFEVNENRNLLRMGPDGSVIHNQRVYKMAETAGTLMGPLTFLPLINKPLHKNLTITALPDPYEAKQNFAEAMMAGHCPSGFWMTLPYRGQMGMLESDLNLATRQYFSFHQKHEDWFENGQTVASIGVLRSSWNLSMMQTESPRAYVAVTEILVRSQLPWRILLDADLKDPCQIAGLEVIILPSNWMMSEEQIAGVFEFLSRGGKVLFTGYPGLLTNDYRQREEWPFAKIAGHSFFDGQSSSLQTASTLWWSPATLPDAKIESVPLYGDLPHYGELASYNPRGGYYAPLPEDFEGMKKQLTDWLPPQRIRVEAPSTVLVNRTRTKESALIHLIRLTPRSSSEGISIRLRLSPEQSACDQALWWTPEAQSSSEIAGEVLPDGKEQVFHLNDDFIYGVLQLPVGVLL